MTTAVSWSHWYRFASYAKGSLWIVPFVAIGIEVIASGMIEALDRRRGSCGRRAACS